MSEKFEVSATSRRGVEQILATADNTTLVIKATKDGPGRCFEDKTIPGRANSFNPPPENTGHHWPPDNPRESGRRSDGKPEVSGRCFEGETLT